MTWILAKDQLPAINQVVLVRGESYDSGYQDGFELARRGHDGDWIIGKQEERCHDVTHWMALPPPPTE